MQVMGKNQAMKLMLAKESEACQAWWKNLLRFLRMRTKFSRRAEPMPDSLTSALLTYPRLSEENFLQPEYLSFRPISTATLDTVTRRLQTVSGRKRRFARISQSRTEAKS